MASVFLLGPSLDDVIEPMPEVTVPGAVTPGRRRIAFAQPPTAPGGNVNLTFLPPVAPGDAMPVNVYAFFCQPVQNVPAIDQRTPDWFFKNADAHGFTPIKDESPFTVTAQGVRPSLQPYSVQAVLEFSA